MQTKKTVIKAASKPKVAGKRVVKAGVNTGTTAASKSGVTGRQSARGTSDARTRAGLGPGQPGALNLESTASVLRGETPLASYTTRMRAIGNSKGVILNNHAIATAGLSPDADLLIQVGDGVIVIAEVKSSAVNTDLSSWDKQFKAAMKKGAKPEKDMFEGLENDFDKKEW